MKIATSWGLASDPGSVIHAYDALVQSLGAPPSYLYVSCSANDPIEEIVATLRLVAPHTPLHGSTSCFAAMTQEGLHRHDAGQIALFGLFDPAGAYGVGAAKIGHHPQEAAQLATRAALAMAQCGDETPAMVWMTAAPGQEEALLAGIAEVLGRDVPITGGSSADDTIGGKWKQIANADIWSDAIVLTVLFPSTEVIFAFHSGYEPTTTTGIATKVAMLDPFGRTHQDVEEGRILVEIDHRPAAEVYNDWCGGALAPSLAKGGKILAQTALCPLGRVAGAVQQVPYYQLVHPEAATPEGTLVTFANLSRGDRLVLMHGRTERLIERAGHVAASTLRANAVLPEEIAGALVVYCAGCMLTVREHLSLVVAGLCAALPEIPFLGIYTLGEQGCFLSGENRHGNLMISLLLFRKD